MTWDITFNDPKPLILKAVAEIERIVDFEFFYYGAKKLAPYTRSIAPVKTGRLRDSIQVFKVGYLHITLGIYVYYASFIEFGTFSIAGRWIIERTLYKHGGPYSLANYMKVEVAKPANLARLKVA